MIRRTMLAAGLALAAIAMAAPSAGAEIYLSDDTADLEVGAQVRTTSKDFVATLAEEVKLECAVVKIYNELVDAGPEHLEIQQLAAAETFNCQLNREAIKGENLPATVEDVTFGVGKGNIVTIDTWGTTNTNIAFTTKIYADGNHQILVGTCSYSGEVHAGAKADTGDLIEMTPSPLEGACGEVTLEGEFTLETPEDGHEIQIHYEETS